MARMLLDREAVEAAVLGGAVLGGGGGGSIEWGRRQGMLAVQLGRPELIDPEDLSDDATLVTVSAVGSPASTAAFVLPMDYVRAVELVTASGAAVDGLITNECGGLATVNGWFQAAVLGLPVVDAPCNGRAHPTGLMGSMGLQRLPEYTAIQAAVGGDAQAGRRVEMLARGQIERAAALVLQASIQAGGMVAVARNPVSVAYAREHAAPGAIRQCLAVGRAIQDRRGAGPEAAIAAVAETLGGQVAAVGRVAEVTLETVSGLDVGTIRVEVGQGSQVELVFWNEYMCLDAIDGSGASRRLATFPDLLATFDTQAGLPISSAEVRVGQTVTILQVDRHRLRLGAGVKDADLLRTVETATGREVLRYLGDDLAAPQAAGE